MKLHLRLCPPPPPPPPGVFFFRCIRTVALQAFITGGLWESRGKVVAWFPNDRNAFPRMVH